MYFLLLYKFYLKLFSVNSIFDEIFMSNHRAPLISPLHLASDFDYVVQDSEGYYFAKFQLTRALKRASEAAAKR